MRRFALFGWEDHGNLHGWQCFDGSYDTADNAVAKAREQESGNADFSWHVVDLETGTIVAESL